MHRKDNFCHRNVKTSGLDPEYKVVCLYNIVANVVSCQLKEGS